MQTSWRTYLEKRGIRGPWCLNIPDSSTSSTDQVVVIPCLAESPRLFRTLSSLALNPSSELDRTLVVCVVNQPDSGSSEATRTDNRFTLGCLEALRSGISPGGFHSPETLHQIRTILASRLRLAYIDASSDGLGLPARHAGVGLARKIGMDLALMLLGPSPDPVRLFCLDADTVVEPNYLACVRNHFHLYPEGAAVLPYLHPLTMDGPESRAAIEYELFLRSYVLGLHYAGSPYAFHTVGSAMCCSADAYVRAGGMNRRPSTEDFYFLQNLAKSSGISQVRGTFVYPEARGSDRVPFVGTGWTISRYLQGNRGLCHVYDTDVFECLRVWLDALNLSVSFGPDKALACARKMPAKISDFLKETSFIDTWWKLRRNYSDDVMFRKQLHVWFDGFRTLKMLNDLTRAAFPRKPPHKEVPRLLACLGVAISRPVGQGDREEDPAFALLHTCRAYEYGPLPGADPWQTHPS